MNEQTAAAGRKTGLAPLLCPHPRLLILGSLPGDRSLELQEYYGHPQNRFWKVLAAVHGLPCPDSYEQKKAMLAHCCIALWDIYHAASRPGSMDADIRHAEFNDIAGLLADFPEIGAVALNGSTAAKGFDAWLTSVAEEYSEDFPSTSAEAAKENSGGTTLRLPDGSFRRLRILRLPSTSPANARWSPERLADAWKCIRPSDNAF